jgi:hypothetical protein
MKKIYIALFLSLFTLSMQSQWLWDYGVAIGASNYLGDIGGKEGTRKDFIADMKLSKTRYNFGGFIRYKWRPKLSLKLALDYLRIEGDDKLSANPGRKYRNFNFRNDMFDLGFTGELFFYENNDLGNTYKYRNGFRAYVFGGVGAFYSNPKSLYQGQWVALRSFANEGVAYKGLGLNIPMGIGFYFTIDKSHRIGFEMNYRKTFTDYLDDISGNYPATPPGDAYAAGLVLRTPELGPNIGEESNGASYSHDWGQKRGDNTHKDAYLTLSASYSYVIRGKSSFYRARNNGFFSRGGKKRKMRKIRAKF